MAAYRRRFWAVQVAWRHQSFTLLVPEICLPASRLSLRVDLETTSRSWQFASSALSDLVTEGSFVTRPFRRLTCAPEPRRPSIVLYVHRVQDGNIASVGNERCHRCKQDTPRDRSGVSPSFNRRCTQPKERWRWGGRRLSICSTLNKISNLLNCVTECVPNPSQWCRVQRVYGGRRQVVGSMRPLAVFASILLGLSVQAVSAWLSACTIEGIFVVCGLSTCLRLISAPPLCGGGWISFVVADPKLS